MKDSLPHRHRWPFSLEAYHRARYFIDDRGCESLSRLYLNILRASRENGRGTWEMQAGQTDIQADISNERFEHMLVETGGR